MKVGKYESWYVCYKKLMCHTFKEWETKPMWLGREILKGEKKNSNEKKLTLTYIQTYLENTILKPW